MILQNFAFFQEIYRIKLPGNPTQIGEGKPENQNHAIIFTRGEALQTIDMNQVISMLSSCESTLKKILMLVVPCHHKRVKGMGWRWKQNLQNDFYPLFQDNYFEEAFKMRNVLEEFLKSHRGQRKPTILGLREHIFTGRSVLS